MSYRQEIVGGYFLLARPVFLRLEDLFIGDGEESVVCIRQKAM